MKIAIAQLNYLIGDFSGNTDKMLAAVVEARSQQADMIVFSELATTGYPPRDFLEFDNFLELAQQSIERLRQASEDMAIVVGSPTVNPDIEGKDLFNSCYFIADKKIIQVAHKTLLPTYDIFDEYRYFEPGSEYQVVEWRGVRWALTVCEDIWNIGNENPMYTVCPMDQLIEQSPDIILNVSASPFNYQQAEERKHIIRSNVERYGIPMIYVNHAGAQTEIIFDGGSVVMAANGIVHDELPYFEEAVRCYSLDEIQQTQVDRSRHMDPIERMYRGIVLGIRDYFQKLGFTDAVLGLSGGIDSALTAAVAAAALGPEHVHCVSMPSEYSSQHSRDDAQQLAENLGCDYSSIPIQDAYQSFLGLLQPHFSDKPFNVTEENIQARCRGVILMALSNKHGYILLNTSNKSEMAVGYGTLYGDLCGGLSVLGDLYKTEVYAMARWINREGIIIPENTISKPPSAELRPDQKDSDSLPEYDILDTLLHLYIEQRMGPDEIIEAGYDAALVERILKLVNRNEFKRYQTAPVLRVSSKAFGMGRRMPIVAKYLG